MAKNYYVVEMMTPGDYDPETAEEAEYLHPFSIDTAKGDTHIAYQYARKFHPTLEVIGHHITSVEDYPGELANRPQYTIQEMNEYIQEWAKKMGLDGSDGEGSELVPV